jgi:hypothetical protein
VKARRTDENHREIVRLYRQAGCSVADTSRLPGFVDIVVGAFGRNHLVEIKDGKKAKSRQSLTQTQKELHDSWRGKITIIRDADDVLRHLATLVE